MIDQGQLKPFLKTIQELEDENRQLKELLGFRVDEHMQLQQQVSKLQRRVAELEANIQPSTIRNPWRWWNEHCQ